MNEQNLNRLLHPAYNQTEVIPKNGVEQSHDLSGNKTVLSPYQVQVWNIRLVRTKDGEGMGETARYNRLPKEKINLKTARHIPFLVQFSNCALRSDFMKTAIAQIVTLLYHSSEK